MRTLYLILLDFLTAYKFKLVVDKKLIKKWKFVYYLSQGYELLVLALTIEIKKEFMLELVTLVPLLLLFKEVKGLNIKILHSLFLFRGKVPKVQREDSKFNKFTFLKNDPVANSPQKCRAGKASKKSLKKKLKIGLAEPLVFSKANRQKGKAVMITKANREVIVKKI